MTNITWQAFTGMILLPFIGGGVFYFIRLILKNRELEKKLETKETQSRIEKSVEKTVEEQFTLFRQEIVRLIEDYKKNTASKTSILFLAKDISKTGAELAAFKDRTAGLLDTLQKYCKDNNIPIMENPIYEKHAKDSKDSYEKFCKLLEENETEDS